MIVGQIEFRNHVAEEPGSDEGISERARGRGYRSLDDLKMAVLAQRAVWWQGKAFHCPLCNVDFVSSQRAAEHVVQQQHPVLRMD